MYEVLISQTAEKQLKKLPSDAQRRIAAVIVSLGIDPRPVGSKKLTGSANTYRTRVGDYRVIYEIHDRKVIIAILKIGHRKDVYRQ